MQITVLAENTTCREDLASEHGLSLYLETAGRRILFDAGQTGAFAENAEKLGIDLRSVDFAVVSHGHYDHGGGLKRFLEINPSAPVYLHREAFGGHYHGPEKYIGLDPALQGHPRLVFTEGRFPVAPGLTLFSADSLPCPYPANSYGLTLLEEGRHIPDPFRHEQYLLVEENGKRILISGCSHKGILNIAAHFRPDVLIGGFHLVKLDPRKDAAALDRAARVLLESPTQYYTGHCTGQAQLAYLQQHMGMRLLPLTTGMLIGI